MKVGIITDFSTNTVNYGNNLQAYAASFGKDMPPRENRHATGRFLKRPFFGHGVIDSNICFFSLAGNLDRIIMQLPCQGGE